MTVYMVERDLPGITLEQLGGAQKAAIETSLDFTSQGKQVRYIRSTRVPGDSKVMCLFESSGQQLVEEVNQAANIPFTRVVEWGKAFEKLKSYIHQNELEVTKEIPYQPRNKARA